MEATSRPQSMPAFASNAASRYDQHIQQQQQQQQQQQGLSLSTGGNNVPGGHQMSSGGSNVSSLLRGNSVSCPNAKNLMQQQPGKLYRVIYPYKPQQADELALTIGDILTVTMQCDDGWFVGHSTLTGNYGTFPGNYVQAI